MNTQSRSSKQSHTAGLSEKNFLRIVHIAKLRWGLNIDSAKSPLIHSRLNRRMNILKLDSFDEYLKMVESENSGESKHFISALTTNVTHFYRELHHFKFLEKDVLPKLAEDARKGNKIRLWSAGCSSGQEAYSLAGSLANTIPDAGNLDIRVLATDVDSTVLDKAENGVYAEHECKFPTTDLKSRIFEQTNELTSASRTVRSEIRSLVTFRNVNLVEDWALSEKMNVIMCRNVAIYFDKSTQHRLWSRFSDLIKPRGYLFIGHSERIKQPTDFNLSVVGTTVYQK